MYQKIKSIAGLGLAIFISGFIIVAFIGNNAPDSNALASELAKLKVEEIQAEQQIQLWTAKKTATTKSVVEMNSKIAEAIKQSNPEAIPFQ